MGDTDNERQTDEPSPAGSSSISLTGLWRAIRAQPLYEKVFFWGLLVYSLSVWGTGTGLAFAGLLTLTNLLMLTALVLHVLALVGIGPGGRPLFYKTYRWLVLVGAGVFVLHMLTALPDIVSWRFTAWLCMLALAVHLWGLYHILEAKQLLPFRTKR